MSETKAEKRARIKAKVSASIRKLADEREDREFVELCQLGYSEKEAGKIVRERTKKSGAFGRGRGEIQPNRKTRLIEEFEPPQGKKGVNNNGKSTI